MTDEVISPLRRRMIEDMTIRKLAPKTQMGYIRHIKNFAAFLGRSPDSASADDLRHFQLHQRQNGVQPSSMNSAVSALHFFFGVTLDRPDLDPHSARHTASLLLPRFPPLEASFRGAIKMIVPGDRDAAAGDR